MKTKWNWGTKLAIWIIVFILFILTLVYMSFSYDIGLVEKDYYPKGLKYQSRINAVNNAKNINAVFSISQEGENVIIEMPDIQAKDGTVTFFRPSDNTSDRVYNLNITEEKKIKLPKSEFIIGKYIVKFSWKHLNKDYYVEQVYFVK
ncbi:MAG: FixH family protein [Bacteroidetes bacterium]|nr:FixH family protein [Bacteroidota bacterium]